MLVSWWLRLIKLLNPFKKQPSRYVIKKTCSKKMLQIYRRSPMPKCHFNKIALRQRCSPVNLLRIFRTPCLKNTSGRLLLPFHATVLFLFSLKT